MRLQFPFIQVAFVWCSAVLLSFYQGIIHRHGVKPTYTFNYFSFFVYVILYHIFFNIPLWYKHYTTSAYIQSLWKQIFENDLIECINGQSLSSLDQSQLLLSHSHQIISPTTTYKWCISHNMTQHQLISKTFVWSQTFIHDLCWFLFQHSFIT